MVVLTVLTCVVVPLTVRLPPTVRLLVTLAVPVTVSAEPLNVRFPLSSISPDVPARTTLPEVRSDTLAVAATKPSPPEMLAPPLASSIPPNVPIPVSYTHLTLPTSG